jgi:tripartite-type tricarboxylate transporter receptor subunit TctC
LNKALGEVVAQADVKKQLIADGGGAMASSPEEYADNIVREEGKWSAIVKKLGIKVE